MKSRPWTKTEIAFIRRHVRRLNARQIGERLGRTKGAVQQMRARLGLDTPVKSNPALVAAVKRLHADGLSDREAATALGMDRENVRLIRQRLELPANGWNEHQRERTRRHTADRLAKLGLNSLAELRAKAFADYAERRGWPRELSPRAVQILELLWANGPQTREQLAVGLGLKYRGAATNLRGGVRSGSYLPQLEKRGLLVVMKRAIKRTGKGKSVSLYTLPIHIQRKVS